MSQYRIIKETLLDDNIIYFIETRTLFRGWVPVGYGARDTYNTLEKAKERIGWLRGFRFKRRDIIATCP